MTTADMLLVCRRGRAKQLGVHPVREDAECSQVERVNDFFSGPQGRANYNRLVLYAEWQSRRYAWLSGWTSGSGQQLLHEAIRRCLTPGEDGGRLRNFPPGVPVEAALRQLIRSLANHAYAGPDARAQRVDFDLVDGLASQASRRHALDRIIDADERMRQLIELSSGDHLVHEMLVLLRDEQLFKPAQALAQRLGVSVSDIFNARKRLLRLIRRFERNIPAA